MSTKIKIRKNYGCLSAEKRIIYTYGAAAGTAVYSEEITVDIPDGWEVNETAYGNVVCTSPWGTPHNINHILCGNETPYFEVYDNDGKLHRLQLKVVKE